MGAQMPHLFADAMPLNAHFVRFSAAPPKTTPGYLRGIFNPCSAFRLPMLQNGSDNRSASVAKEFKLKTQVSSTQIVVILGEFYHRHLPPPINCDCISSHFFCLQMRAYFQCTVKFACRIGGWQFAHPFGKHCAM